MNNTTIIIFSKNRTLQLKSLILSMLHYTDINLKNIYVIYKCDSETISYKSLIDEFKSVNFIKEGMFLQDVKNIIKNSTTDYFQFMVDDLIVRTSYTYKDIESLLDSEANIDSVAPRMGLNITVEPKPEKFIEYSNGFISWQTDSNLGAEWNYCWDMSSSIYRRKLVETYLIRCRPTKEFFPNPFEDHFYQCMPTTRKSTCIVNIINAIRFLFSKKSITIACMKESLVFVQNVNEVAAIDNPGKDKYTPEFLHKKMMDGYIVDYEKVNGFLPQSHNNPDPCFKLKERP